MLNYFVKSKVSSGGKIAGIILNNGKEDKFVEKSNFGKFSDSEFINARITADGKVIATKGKIPMVEYEDYINERNKSLKTKDSLVLYHGSPDIIEKPIHGYGNRRNDYGVGFYCTQDIELGKEWACSRNPQGILNSYVLNINGLRVLNLGNKTREDILRWFAILATNRVIKLRPGTKKDNLNIVKNAYYPKGIENYDVIIGYRADDSYFSYATDFATGTLSIEGLSHAMFLGRLGLQVVLITKKAFSQLTFLEYQTVGGNYHQKYKMRDKKARQEYFDYADSGHIYIEHIVRELRRYGKAKT